MLRSSNATIRTKLYGIVVFSAVGLAVVLTLALYLLATYGVNGPVYQRLMVRKSALAEIAPCTLFIIEPYLTLSKISSATEPAEVKRLIEDFHQREDNYKTQ